MACESRPSDRPARRRLHVLQQELDRRVAAQNARVAADGMPSRCSKRCDACCHSWVDALPEEAQAMLDAVRAREGEAGVAAVLAAAKEHVAAAKSEHAHTAEAWFRLRRPCLFLRDRTCSVYDVRPGTCRVYHVASDPEDCSLDRPGHPVTRINHLLAYYDYVMQSPATTDFLPALLLSVAEGKAPWT